ncbi:Maf family nucleotide pyrophosphatase [Rhodocytophaga aerolata]|uniref:dTTP/UTP pyrophosphatase n=1 Tax=Rhodocytophaga aerolata TaxID=455078 RepID=A0ABT8RG23_9BACT|nr:Maf family nucleotide pyrophosphatase [Rhodocytophaga aerolata]MDO1451035.1 Maf family nucleotide pyrophosphatase [Rhodocytophaga aerolata]
MNFNYPLVLASSSPRRQQLLMGAGLVFSVKTKNVPEDFPEDMPVKDVPVYLAKRKAMSFAAELTDEIILAADTVVIINGRILNKPQNEQEAVEMLSLLSGKKHEVVTGVCLFSQTKTHTFSDLTEVYFRNLSAAEITFYVENYRPFDKAGAYGAQEWMGMIAIEKIIGSYFNVMGLPVHLVYEYLKQWDT